MFQKKTPFEKEWEDLRIKEQRFLKKRSERKESFLNRQLAEKVPEKLQTTLSGAFEKAFGVIFEKGSAVIDKTFNKKKMEDAYKINEFTDSVKQSRKTLRVFSKNAKNSGVKNLLLSGTAGIGMGFVGVGLPDIPLFTAMVLKSIYEIALSFGFGYDTEEEQYFILKVICGAVSSGEEVAKIDEEINLYIKERRLSPDYQKEELIKRTAQLLSKELLYMKFLQGVPVVGVVGGAYDAVYMKQITEYANLKYRHRFLTNRKK